MGENLAGAGFFFVLVGIILWVISIATKPGKTKFAIGGFFGPLPFGFANSPLMLWIVIALTALMVVINFIQK